MAEPWSKHGPIKEQTNISQLPGGRGPALIPYLIHPNLDCLKVENTAKVGASRHLPQRRSHENIYRVEHGLWLSLVERCVRDAEVVGSNPTSPTIFLCPNPRFYSVNL